MHAQQPLDSSMHIPHVVALVTTCTGGIALFRHARLWRRCVHTVIYTT